MLKQLKLNVLRAACVAAALVFGSVTASTSATVTMDWVTIGNAGNAADINGRGAVNYEYNIGKYLVTNAQYAEFLNAVATTSDPNRLYNTSMGSRWDGGIERLGTSGNHSFVVRPNMGDKPVNSVNWYSAARFSNWMTNGQGSGDTESGVYTLTGRNSISAITRDLSNPNQVFIPTEDEWYKAAYHQPVALGGPSNDYWLYATASNDVPTVAIATATGDIANPGQNVANYANGFVWNNSPDGLGNVSTVGSAGPDSESFYGTADQAGNTREWNEREVSGGAQRGWLGGFYSGGENLMSSSTRGSAIASSNFGNMGFRVASPIPEPGSLVLLGLGGLTLLARRRRSTAA
jgi:formylglycine-generating enzyme required for sulfatase activity